MLGFDVALVLYAITSPGQKFRHKEDIIKIHERIPRRSGEEKGPFYVASVAE